MDGRWARLRAARWVVLLGRGQWLLLVLGALELLVVALVGGVARPGAGLVALLGAVLYAALAAAWGALLRGFEAHRRGAWQLMVGLVLLGLVSDGARLVAGGGVLPWLGVAVDAFLLVLLQHPDTREWVSPEPAPAGPAAPPTVPRWTR